ncbi:MAG: hypothetical protein GYA24_08590 [Candidatus Lokiarchaeota archaeon]|nr:hypothetical protein [Candidatus Lokiarchaeota archaeon]
MVFLCNRPLLVKYPSLNKHVMISRQSRRVLSRAIDARYFFKPLALAWFFGDSHWSTSILYPGMSKKQKI